MKCPVCEIENDERRYQGRKREGFWGGSMDIFDGVKTPVNSASFSW